MKGLKTALIVSLALNLILVVGGFALRASIRRTVWLEMADHIESDVARDRQLLLKLETGRVDDVDIVKKALQRSVTRGPEIVNDLRSPWE